MYTSILTLLLWFVFIMPPNGRIWGVLLCTCQSFCTSIVKYVWLITGEPLDLQTSNLIGRLDITSRWHPYGIEISGQMTFWLLTLKAFHYLKTASQVFNVKLLIGYYFGLCIFDSIFCVSWQPVAQERGCIMFDKHLMYLFLSLKIDCSAFIVSLRKLCAFLVSMFKSLEKNLNIV